ncbi:MAG: F420-dependent oxidoreductase [Sphingomonas bacterium]|uniref:pyrroline-5-carboxylate reductase n=1 Tax=Sphingomonas bacterium TaxID=1895847 RepID=UPI00261C3E48|nr:pyrroline-5-carboxylate reductase [Sphingomonas bacterium]MDB5705172.1 F420-dependent oxidoreductase [Sphingomonas bacterium]
MNLGFVGTGTISAAIVRGLGAAFGEGSTIHLSPRGADIAAGLARQFPHVRVAASNQAVLDASQVVMLAVRPQIATDVIGDLAFRPDHHVISLIATFSLETLADLVAPARTVTRAVPLPAVALGRGPTAIFPPDPVAAGLFDRTGSSIQVDSADRFDALSAATATMASYFAFADSIACWLTAQGVAAPDSRRYVAAIFEGLAATAAAASDQGFASLATEHATLGGLNEQLLKRLDGGLNASLQHGLDEILSRIRAGSASG